MDEATWYSSDAHLLSQTLTSTVPRLGNLLSDFLGHEEPMVGIQVLHQHLMKACCVDVRWLKKE